MSTARPALVLAVFAGLPIGLALGSGAPTKAEFQAQPSDYLDTFKAAADELHALFQAERHGVVAVAEFTDMTGNELYIGKLFAEELSTLLLAPRPVEGGKKGPKPFKYRVMDHAAISEFVMAGGGGSLWSSTKKIKEFGKSSGVTLVVTGKIEITNREARFFLKAVETKEASIVWARTLSVPGVAAGTETAVAAVPEPEPLQAAPDVPPASAPATVPTATSPSSEPAATPTTQAAAAPPVTTAAAPAPAPAAVAPIATASLAAPTTTAPTPLATPAVGAEVLTFENGWLRARIVSASKYEGSGWVTVVLDVTNLSDRPVFVDLAQQDPGRGIDEFNNAWRVERVTGLKLAANPTPAMTPLAARGTARVFIILATTVNPSGTRLSFAPNLLWWGSNAAGDAGRVPLAFQNVRVD